MARNNTQDFYFSSFTFNCHGALHPDAFRLLASLAKLGSQGPGRWMGDEKGCLRMIQRRISIAISRAFASNIINSVSGLLYAENSSDQDAAPTRCFNWLNPILEHRRSHHPFVDNVFIDPVCMLLRTLPPLVRRLNSQDNYSSVQLSP